MRRIDLVHMALLLGALLLAYLLPFELFVLSYAVLGPAHYLTEISWLHDRKYYLPDRSVALMLALTALGAMFIASAFWLGLLVLFTFAVCAILATVHRPLHVFLLLAAAVVGFLLLSRDNLPFGLAWVLVPTLIHVSLFTLIFMILGAYRAKSAAQFAFVGLYVLAIAAILVFPPSRATVLPGLAKIGSEYFGDIAPALGSIVGLPQLGFDGRITGLLSFAYTYHYLNWFIKAEVICWTAIPMPRLVAIAAFSLAATGLYFYSYAYGFMVLLALSLAHVLLEFPLNAIAIRDLGRALRRDFIAPIRRRATS